MTVYTLFLTDSEAEKHGIPRAFCFSMKIFCLDAPWPKNHLPEQPKPTFRGFPASQIQWVSV